MKHNFKRLNVWNQSRNLVVDLYELTGNFPKIEQHGLTSQTRLAAISVASNNAEGYGRTSQKQLAHFLNIAIGSTCEIETQLYLSMDLRYLNTQQTEFVLTETNTIRKILFTLRKRALTVSCP
ncbi:MAG: four helix bundle protein [Calditrichia bacterium]